MKKSLILAPLLLSIIMFLYSKEIPSSAFEEEEIITLIETAKIPEDHIKIAEFYEMQAAKAGEKANKHDAMAEAYKDRSKPMPGMVNHCEDLVKDYKAEAAEYSKMAAVHRKMAQEIQEQK